MVLFKSVWERFWPWWYSFSRVQEHRNEKKCFSPESERTWINVRETYVEIKFNSQISVHSTLDYASISLQNFIDSGNTSFLSIGLVNKLVLGKDEVLRKYNFAKARDVCSVLDVDNVDIARTVLIFLYWQGNSRELSRILLIQSSSNQSWPQCYFYDVTLAQGACENDSDNTDEYVPLKVRLPSGNDAYCTVPWFSQTASASLKT